MTKMSGMRLLKMHSPTLEFRSNSKGGIYFGKALALDFPNTNTPLFSKYLA